MLITSKRMTRYMKKVTFEADDGCWLWSAPLNVYGYGAVNIHGRTCMIHRVFYEFYVGKIPRGLTIDHLCRVRNCVNPKHMEPVSAAENTRRGFARYKTRTHCKVGHELVGDSVFLTENGSRRCRVCQRENSRRNAQNQKRQRRRTPQRRKIDIADLPPRLRASKKPRRLAAIAERLGWNPWTYETTESSRAGEVALCGAQKPHVNANNQDR